MKEFNLTSKNDNLKTKLTETTLIGASAGTGKTYTITGIFLRLLLEENIEAQKILVVTFTNKAASELKARIRLLLQNFNHKIEFPKIESKDILVNEIYDEYKNILIKNHDKKKIIQESIRNFDFMSIETIHSFCQKTINEYAFESNVNYDMILTDIKDLEQQLIEDFYRIEFQNASRIFNEIYSYAEVTKDLKDFLKNITNYPKIKILPHKINANIKEKLLEIYDIKISAKKEINNLWQKNKMFLSDKDTIKKVKELCINSGFFKSSLKEKDVIKKLNKLETFFLSDNFPFDNTKDFFKKHFHYFSIDKLEKEKYVKFKEEGISDCKFFIIFQELYDKIPNYLEIKSSMAILVKQYKIFILLKWKDYVKEELDKRKKVQNIFTFQDMINITAKAVKNEKLLKSLQTKYKVALIDEFQDTDPIQYEIFDTIFNSNNNSKTNKQLLFFIGDPKQSIYKFRGADIFSYFNVVNKIKNKYTLKVNYRSSKKCVDAVNTIFSNSNNPFIYNEIEFDKISADKSDLTLINQGNDISGLHITLFNNPENKNFLIKDEIENIFPRKMVSDIISILHGNKDKKLQINNQNINESDITILVKTNKQALLIQELLNEKKIKSVIYSDSSIWQSDEAIQLNIILETILNYDKVQFIVRLLATNIFNFSAKDIYQIINNKNHQDNNTKIEIIEQFKNANQNWKHFGIYSAVKTLFLQFNIEIKLFEYKNAERIFTNFYHILELLQKEEIEKKLSQDAMLDYIQNKIENSDKTEDSEIRLESEEKSIKIMTIHKSKGLEFNIVFLPFLYENGFKKKVYSIYHDDKQNNELILNLEPEEEHYVLQQKEEKAENLRAFYVAITRAKYKTYLYWGMLGQHYKKNSIFQLLHKKDSNYEDVLIDINNLSTKSNNSILYTGISDEEIKNLLENKTTSLDQEYQSKKQKKIDLIEPSKIPYQNLQTKYSINSYSSLIHTKHISENHIVFIEKNIFTEEKEQPIDFFNKDKTIFDFPKGSLAGNTIHNILENIDFQKLNIIETEKKIKEILEKDNFNKDNNKWHYRVIYDMIDTLLNKPLFNKDNFSLKNLSKENKIPEMEFLFSFNQLKLNKIFAIIKEELKESKNIDLIFTDNKTLLSQGFIKGFIDLIFVYNGKYYIVDWKSNFLGSTKNDYNQENMKQTMNNNQYYLQYYIYTIALHRFLKQNIDDYDYNKHFGGVLYLFVRGISKSSNTGIFFDLPKKDTIKKINNLLSNY